MKPVLEPEAPDLACSFVIDDSPALTVLGRSELERWSQCPAQAALLASGRVNNHSAIAEAGEQVHLAFSYAIDEYMTRGGFVPPGELAEEVWLQLRGSRPDVQPAAIAGARASVYAFAKFITALHPENILRFDGGKGDKSGMLAHDFPDLGLRFCGEVDLLHATASPEVLGIEDWKSGWRIHGAEQVKDSFQFQSYSALVLLNYEEIKAVQVKIWNTRSNTQTYAVMFPREQLHTYMARIRSAAGEWYKWRGHNPEQVETWPDVDKCAICPAAALCPAAKHVGQIAKDPQAYVLNIVAMQAQIDAVTKLAATYAEEHGDIVAGSVRFGRNYPASERRRPAKLYSIGASAKGDEQ